MDSFVVQWTSNEGDGHGALSILWDLIESYKVDIFDVSLARITEDFLAYVTESDLDLKEASDFSVMASNLLYYKSQELLPQAPEDEEDTPMGLPAELVHQLLEYKRFQLASGELRQLEARYADSLNRKATNEFKDSQVEFEVNLADLIKAFAKLMVETKSNDMVVYFEADEVSVSDKINFLKESFRTKEAIGFRELLGEVKSRMDIVATFLALLELVKQGMLGVRQEESTSDVEVHRRVSVEGLDAFGERDFAAVDYR